jgi:hypothetical protein
LIKIHALDVMLEHAKAAFESLCAVIREGVAAETPARPTKFKIGCDERASTEPCCEFIHIRADGGGVRLLAGR